MDCYPNAVVFRDGLTEDFLAAATSASTWVLVFAFLQILPNHRLAL
jgi:hypothetical protein